MLPEPKYPIGYEFFRASMSRTQKTDSIKLGYGVYSRSWEEYVPQAELCVVDSYRFNGDGELSYGIKSNSTWSSLSEDCVAKRGFATAEQALEAAPILFPDQNKEMNAIRSQIQATQRDVTMTIPRTTGRKIFQLCEHIRDEKDFDHNVVRWLLDRLTEAGLGNDQTS